MSLKSEIRNNIAHLITGMIVAAAALLLYRHEYAGIIMAGVVGFGVESYQLIGKREPWWIIDRALDLLGYIGGGAIMTFIFVAMRWV